MRRSLLMFAVALRACFMVIADSFDDYIAFCKEEFKFEFCGVDDSIAASRVPISQKFVEVQFSSQYNMKTVRKTQYNHLVQFELAATKKENYEQALSNLVADVELAFKNCNAGPGHKSNFFHLIKMVEFSIARINEANSGILVDPHDIDKILPRKLFEYCSGNDFAIKRYAMMRDLLIIGSYIYIFKKSTGYIPLSIGDMNIAEEHSVRTKNVEYIKHGNEWQLIAAPRRINVKLIEFDKYVPLIMGRPERFWKFDSCIMLSSSFSKKRKDLYKGEIVNKGTLWACRMDGGQVVPCVIKHSKIGVAGLAITIAGEAQPMNWELLGTIYNIRDMKTKY